MVQIPVELAAYYESGKPLVCELDESPYLCEFWPLAELAAYNRDYEVPRYAPGYVGFGTSGGGEMYAIAPSGAVVCIPFIGMSASLALPLAASWSAFVPLLRKAL